MIPYIEVLNKATRQQAYIIEPLEVWLEQSYYTVGEFELVARATPEALEALTEGNYIRIPNNSAAWLIDGIEYTFTVDKGRTILAKGREVKALLEKRIINSTMTTGTNLATAVNNLVNKNAGAAAGSVRALPSLTILNSSVSEVIDDAQVSYDNLLTYTDTLLQAHNCGARMTIEGGAFKYEVYKGQDKTASVVFSQSYDNLLDSKYTKDNRNVKSFAYIGGLGEGLDRIFNTYAVAPASGVDRSEVFIDAKDVAAKYEDAAGVEHELDLTNSTDLATYKSWLTERGKEKLAEYISSETFTGNIDTSSQLYDYGTDYELGDIVRIQDEYFNLYKDTRIIKRTIAQQSDKYVEYIDYE